MHRSISAALLAAMLLQQTACMSAPRPVASPRTFIPARQPERVWITDQQGNRVEVVAPRALGDTLFGRTPQGEEVWIAFADLPRLEARELDKTKTYAVVGGIAVGAALLMLMSRGGGAESPPENVDRPHVPGPGIVLFRR